MPTTAAGSPGECAAWVGVDLSFQDDRELAELNDLRG